MRENIFACVQFRTSMITHWYGHLKKKKKRLNCLEHTYVTKSNLLYCVPHTINFIQITCQSKIGH